MDDNQVLHALIDHVNASDKLASLNWDEAGQWQEGVLERFVAAGLLVKDVNTQSLQCNGCEHHCFMPVFLSDDKARAFIVCDHPEMQEQMGRIKVPVERLQQWQTSASQFAVVIAGLLKIETKPVYQKDAANHKLGMLQGSRGRRWVFLTDQPMEIEINSHRLPLKDVLYFNDNELTIDQFSINELLNSTKSVTDKAYTPNADKREAGKLATQAMYKDWQDEYTKLKRKYPGKTDTWYSSQIAKLPIAQQRDSETIRKHMKR